MLEIHAKNVETCQRLSIFLNYPAKIPILWRIMKRQVTLDIFLLRFFAAITMRCHLKWALKASIIKSFTSCLGVKSPFPLNSYPHRHHFFSNAGHEPRTREKTSNGSSFVWKFSKGQYPLRTFAQITLVTKRGESWSSSVLPNKTQREKTKRRVSGEKRSETEEMVNDVGKKLFKKLLWAAE